MIQNLQNKHDFILLALIFLRPSYKPMFSIFLPDLGKICLQSQVILQQTSKVKAAFQLFPVRPVKIKQTNRSQNEETLLPI